MLDIMIFLFDGLEKIHQQAPPLEGLGSRFGVEPIEFTSSDWQSPRGGISPFVKSYFSLLLKGFYIIIIEEFDKVLYRYHKFFPG